MTNYILRNAVVNPFFPCIPGEEAPQHPTPYTLPVPTQQPAPYPCPHSTLHPTRAHTAPSSTARRPHATPPLPSSLCTVLFYLCFLEERGEPCNFRTRCEQLCYVVGGHPVCDCYEGYYLISDGGTCRGEFACAMLPSLVRPLCFCCLQLLQLIFPLSIISVVSANYHFYLCYHYTFSIICYCVLCVFQC